MKKDEPTVTHSCGNVFADMGLPNPEQEHAKVVLSLAIKDAIEDLGLTQVAASKLTKESQPNLSNIVGGRLRHFSCERLMRILTALGKNVEVSIKDAPGQARGQFLIVGQGQSIKRRPRVARG